MLRRAAGSERTLGMVRHASVIEHVVHLSRTEAAVRAYYTTFRS